MADYRLSYPDATDEDIEDWVWGADTEPPPILRRATGFWDAAPEQPELSALGLLKGRRAQERSSSATHSTWCVIGKMSKARRPLSR